MSHYLPHTILGSLELFVLLVCIPWVLLTKKDPTSATAWCLLVIFLPIVGGLLFWVFGYNYLLHQMRYRRFKPSLFRERHLTQEDLGPADPANLAHIARSVRAFPVVGGNAVTCYRETSAAFADLLAAIEGARHHVHLEYFILRSDATGMQLLEVLTKKAKEGVQVRLLYDAMGGLHFKRSALVPLTEAGGEVAVFLPLNPLRSLIRVSLRNHRKIAVVDGRVAFTGGMNIGDEYLGKGRLGYWRDAVLRIEGPAAGQLQRVFCEDWEFATRTRLEGTEYFPTLEAAGSSTLQVASSGPDQEVNTIREIYFAAILAARKRVWIASPYVIPDAGLFDALRLARHRGVDVRVLSLARPDHYVSYYAGRYYAAELLGMGVKVYQYQRGMMHAKTILVDSEWAMVGSANLDNRSLHLNFEVGCLLHDANLAAGLEEEFLRDLEVSVPMDHAVLARRTLAGRVLDNACRLLAPTL